MIGMKKLFKNRNYMLLFMGSLVSSIGTVLFSFASGLYVQDIFNKPIYGNRGAFYFSIVVGVSIFGKVIFSPLAGALIDRLNKVKILYLTDIFRGIMFFVLIVLLRVLSNDYHILILFIIVSFLSGSFQALFNPASGSLLPEVVGDNMLQKANGLNSIISSFKTIFGVLVGMVLYELIGIEMAILVNAISFVISGFSEMFIKVKFKEKIKKERNIKADIKAGFVYLKNHQALLSLLTFSLILNFAFSPLFSIAIPYLFYTELNLSSYYLGAINIVVALTTLVIEIYVGMKVFKSIKKTVKISFIGMFVVFILIASLIIIYNNNLLTFWPFYIIFLLLIIAITSALIFTNIPINSNLVRSIDSDYRGRVLSLISAASGLTVPLSYMLAGKLIELTGVSTTLFVYSLVLVIPVVGFLTNKRVKKFIGGFK